MKREITLAKGGTSERTIDISRVEIPDLWHVAMHLKGSKDPVDVRRAEMILECWHLAHDLKRHIQEEIDLDINKLFETLTKKEGKK